MTRKNIIGAGVCILIFLLAFVFWDNRLAFLNLSGLAVVICGTLAAVFLSHPYDNLMTALRTGLQAYRTRPPESASIVQSLLELSIKSRCHGLLSLEKNAGEHGNLQGMIGVKILLDGVLKKR